MTHWSHGYNVSNGYTYHHFREQSPLWLEWVARLNQHVPPLHPKNYLELGCGQGVGLLALASCYPDIHFLGIDFHPGHIAHANQLAKMAGLSNIEFIEADFLCLAQNWPANWPAFDYVVLHGVLSWVPDEVRSAVFKCLDLAVSPGGLVCASYNAMPGWVSALPIQHLLRRYQLVSNQGAEEALLHGRNLLKQLLENGAAAGSVLPQLLGRLRKMDHEDPAYLSHEYLHDIWKPFWFSQVATEMEPAKLAFVGSATLPNNHLMQLLPSSLTDSFGGVDDPVFRQELLDTCINQNFRRDVFQRGHMPTWILGAGQPIEQVSLTFLTMPEGQMWSFKLPIGELKADMTLYPFVMQAVSQRNMTIAEIFALPELRSFDQGQVLAAISILLDQRYLAPYREVTEHKCQMARQLNQVIAAAVTCGAPYTSLSCPRLGGAQEASMVDFLLLDCVSAMATPAKLDELSAGLIVRLQRLGRCLMRKGAAVTNEAELQDEARNICRHFLANTLPRYQAWGAY